MILEELDEFKEEVFKRREQRDKFKMLLELAHTATMCQRAAEDLGLLDVLEMKGAAAETFEAMLEGARKALACLPAPSHPLHKCATPEACKKKFLRQMANRMASDEAVAHQADAIFGKSE